ncbi:MAG TPA: metallophosphoesterase [Thermoleophilaceae bacterium]
MIDWARTVHGIGDLHAGAIAPDRLATVLDDVLTLPTPALHLQIGDATEHGTAAEDEIALDWLARLPGPHRTILGNHDILHNRRTDGQWARAYGLRSKNFVVDLQFARIVAVGPDRNFPAERAGLLSPGTLAWLERELERSPHDCWIASHWPLFGTVLGDPKKLFTSAMSSFHAKPDRDLRKLLARHRNAKAWLSGHTHSPLSAPGLVTRARLARRRTILAVNLSALVGIGKTRKPGDPLRSLYVTHRPDSIEVRFRDHRSGAWVAVGGERVVRARV